MSLALTIARLFAPTVLTTAAGTLYTVAAIPATSVLVNARVRFANTAAATVTVTAYAVPSGGAAAAGNCIANAESIPANAHLDLDVPILAAGDFLQALASANASITATALGGTVIAP